MQDLSYLQSLGGDSPSLKKKILGSKPGSLIAQLLELNESRLQNCIRKNLDDAKQYWTLDRIVDSSLRNMKFVQARELLANKTVLEVDKLIQQFTAWGLNEMLIPVIDANGKPVFSGIKNQPQLELNVPIFDTVFVPLVMAYRSIRWAKIFDDRNQYPLYKYSPAHKTTEAVVKCDIITSVIQRMTEDMDYSSDTKQCILQMLDYGFALRMPESAWFREEWDTKEKGKVVTKTQREGVRWVTPRPERSFIDQSYPWTSLNSDTGPVYLGYWNIKRYGEIKGNKDLWQTDKINFGASSSIFRSSAWGTYQELYPCNVKMPVCTTEVDWNTLDREDKQFWYSVGANEDAACPISVIFTKLIPKDWDLFDYDKPVWFRWLYGDVGTVLYCEILPYTPGAAYLYDYDANRSFQNSLTMHLSPFQQMFGNFLTQHFISVRNNLPRITFYNKDIVQAEHVQRIKAQKSRLYQELTFLPFSKRDQGFQQQTMQDAFFPLAFPQVNTTELASTLRMTIDVLERMLGFPAQEVGQSASHEQTAKEMLIIQDNTTTRQRLTGDGVDAAERAIKRIIYEAWVSYGSDEVAATVVGVDPEREKALKDMGFEVEKGQSNRGNTFGVKGKKSALLMNDFASSQEGHTRAQDPKVAIAMMQMMGVALNNPMIFQSLGVETVVQLLNDVITWSGLPDDFRFKVDPKNTPEAQREELVKAVEGVKGQILEESGKAMEQQLLQVAQSIKEKVVDPLQAELQQVNQVNQVQSAQITEISEAIKTIISGLTQPNINAAPAPPAPPMGIPPGIPMAPQALPPPVVPMPPPPEPAFAGGIPYGPS